MLTPNCHEPTVAMPIHDHDARDDNVGIADVLDGNVGRETLSSLASSFVIVVVVIVVVVIVVVVVVVANVLDDIVRR